MIWEHVELHNVAEAIPAGDGPGVILFRAPGAVRDAVNPDARRALAGPAGVEIRFCCEGPATVRIRCPETTHIHIYEGGFRSGRVVPIRKGSVTFTVPRSERIADLPPDAAGTAGFAPGVIRLLAHGPMDAPITLETVDAPGLRPPRPDELPRLRYLAYGTSITQGVGAYGPHLTFTGWLARHLDADLINLGCSGSCHCEPGMADYIASRTDWDIATLCISTNMIGAGFSPDAFRERADYLLGQITRARPGLPVVCISVLPHYRDLPPGREAAVVDAYRNHLREAVAGCGSRSVVYVNGRDVLPSAALLLTDIIHPSDHGMIHIAEVLGPVLAAALDRS